MLYRLPFLVCLLVLAATPSLAQKRIALVIGNAAYNREVGPLKNPHNDIKLIGDALQRIGFEVMPPVRDARRTDMLVALHDFAEKLGKAGRDAVGLFYYSGHGVASGGENFLVPVDVKAVSRRRMSLAGVRQTEIVKILRDAAPQAAHYLVFDACRNNLGGGKGAKGFVPVRQESGVLIAFATAPGQLASDLGDGGGPYAKALAAEIVKPGVPDLLMFHNVRVVVNDVTRGDQVPWTMDGIRRRKRVFFGSGKPAPAVRPKPSVSEVGAAWALVSRSKDAADLRAFLEQYGAKNVLYRRLAEKRLASLARQRRPNGTARERRKAAPCNAMKVSLGTGEEVCVKPGSGEGFKDCADCPELVAIGAGRFSIRPLLDSGWHHATRNGRARSRRYDGFSWEASLARPVAVSRFLISDALFAKFLRSRRRRHRSDPCWQYEARQLARGDITAAFSSPSRRVATCLTRSRIDEFVRWLSARTGKRYRLLTAAEWEYVAGPGVDWQLSNSQLVRKVRKRFMSAASAVARQRALNHAGIGDLHGGYFEWVRDCGRWSGRHMVRPSHRLRRGKCFSRLIRWDTANSYPHKLRVMTPDHTNPQGNNVITSFRVARDVRR